jgi:hypothetical protein
MLDWLFNRRKKKQVAIYPAKISLHIHIHNDMNGNTTKPPIIQGGEAGTPTEIVKDVRVKGGEININLGNVQIPEVEIGKEIKE